MKNIHILPTDKPSRLFINPLWEKQLRFVKDELIEKKHKERLPQNIYITNSEEIKEGGWILNEKFKDVYKITSKIECNVFNTDKYSHIKKIILTTDQDLIKDGVQEIDDEFLQWFVKNPSCEYVETDEYPRFDLGRGEYKTIIPKEIDVLELGQIIPKESIRMSFGEYLEQDNLMKEKVKNKYSVEEETLYEAAECKSFFNEEDFIRGANWQAERMYSEEDMLMASKYGYNHHKSTQFPEQEFEDSCIRNTQQWLTTLKKK